MIRVMSTNIRFENPLDKENDWPSRKEFLASLIIGNDPDLLGTQEGRRPQLLELDKLLNDYELVCSHRDWITERMYPCIFIKKGKFTVLKSGDKWLSETPDIAGTKSFDSAFPRLMTYAVLEDKSSGLYLLYVNCHLDHIKEATRLEQIKVLSNEILKIQDEWKVPLIISGDFNTSPFSDVRKTLETNVSNLRDPWFDLGFEEETSFHKFDGKDPDGSCTRIDWILHQSPFKTNSIKMIKDHDDGLYPSDHFFIVSEIL